jgi:hypothetical protein
MPLNQNPIFARTRAARTLPSFEIMPERGSAKITYPTEPPCLFPQKIFVLGLNASNAQNASRGR